MACLFGGMMAMDGFYAVLSGLCNYFVIQSTVFYMEL